MKNQDPLRDLFMQLAGRIFDGLAGPTEAPQKVELYGRRVRLRGHLGEVVGSFGTTEEGMRYTVYTDKPGPVLIGRADELELLPDRTPRFQVGDQVVASFCGKDRVCEIQEAIVPDKPMISICYGILWDGATHHVNEDQLRPVPVPQFDDGAFVSLACEFSADPLHQGGLKPRRILSSFVDSDGTVYYDLGPGHSAISEDQLYMTEVPGFQPGETARLSGSDSTAFDQKTYAGFHDVRILACQGIDCSGQPVQEGRAKPPRRYVYRVESTLGIWECIQEARLHKLINSSQPHAETASPDLEKEPIHTEEPPCSVGPLDEKITPRLIYAPLEPGEDEAAPEWDMSRHGIMELAPRRIRWHDRDGAWAQVNEYPGVGAPEDRPIASFFHGETDLKHFLREGFHTPSMSCVYGNRQQVLRVIDILAGALWEDSWKFPHEALLDGAERIHYRHPLGWLALIIQEHDRIEDQIQEKDLNPWELFRTVLNILGPEIENLVSHPTAHQGLLRIIGTALACLTQKTWTREELARVTG